MQETNKHISKLFLLHKISSIIKKKIEYVYNYRLIYFYVKYISIMIEDVFI